MTLDSHRRPRDEEVEPETIEVHNYLPSPDDPADYYDQARDGDDPDEEQTSAGTVVARYPASGFTVHTEGDEIVVYRGSGSPAHKTDLYDFDTTRDSRSGPPRSLAELNRFNADFYRRKSPR